MKYIKSLLCIVLVAFTFAGCSFHIASSVNDLVAPISPFGENADIQSAMNSYVSHGYTLKNPVSGTYKSSYTFFDIDKDGVEEAISFYEPNDNLGALDMAVLKKTDSNWSVVENIKGDGNDIYRLDFKDVDNDNDFEIIVCWDVLSNSTNHVFSIYDITKEKNKFKLSLFTEQLTISDYIFFDYDNDKNEELLIFESSGGSSLSAKATLYSVKKSSLEPIGETKLDSLITSYSDLKIEYAEDDVRVYADAITSDGKYSLTEIIYWSYGYKTIVSPFYDYSTGFTTDTKRKAIISSADLDNDGLIEIPTDKSSKLPAQVKAIDWMVYKNTTLIHKSYSLLVKDDNYHIVLPNGVFEKIKVNYDEDSREMTVTNKSSKNELFSVKPVLKAVYNKNKFQDYTVIMEDSGYYYLAKCSDDADINITLDELKKLIKSC